MKKLKITILKSERRSYDDFMPKGFHMDQSVFVIRDGEPFVNTMSISLHLREGKRMDNWMIEEQLVAEVA